MMMVPLPPDKEFYTVNELAKLLEMKPETIRLMMKRGAIAYYRVGVARRRIRFRRDDIESYLRTRRILQKGGESNN